MSYTDEKVFTGNILNRQEWNRRKSINQTGVITSLFLLRLWIESL